MRYTVTWVPAAQDELASLWLNADSVGRRAITAAANAIDRLLLIDPQSLGESRSKNRRILFVRPLTVVYKFSELDRTVTVLMVGLTPNRSA